MRISAKVSRGTSTITWIQSKGQDESPARADHGAKFYITDLDVREIPTPLSRRVTLSFLYS